MKIKASREIQSQEQRETGEQSINTFPFNGGTKQSYPSPLTGEDRWG